MIRKQFDIVVKEKRDNGGRIFISTGSVDRDKDRVVPTGGKINNYMKNPVVQWGHNYRDPWATIGKTNELLVSDKGIVADFDLRPAANDNDPQSVVLLLWNGGWINAASIGFDPTDGPVQGMAYQENEFGGRDYTDWELLEWSLVPIPANQEALRLAVKGLRYMDEENALIAKPVDVTENYIRIRVRNPDDFQQDSFRTIDIDEGKGIKAIVGKLTGESAMTVQSYLFDKDKWTTEQAQAWVEEHGKDYGETETPEAPIQVKEPAPIQPDSSQEPAPEQEPNDEPKAPETNNNANDELPSEVLDALGELVGILGGVLGM